MKRQWVGIVIAVCFACCTFAQNTSAQNTSAPNALRPFEKNTSPAGGDMNYDGGPVFEATPTVYIVWYGNWTAKDKNIIDYYFAHLGGSTQNKINSTYSDSNNKFVPNKVKHSTENDYHDNYRWERI